MLLIILIFLVLAIWGLTHKVRMNKREKLITKVNVAFNKDIEQIDREIEVQDNSLLLHIIINELEDFLNCQNILQIINKAENLEKRTNEALAIKNDPEYEKFVKWALKEYKINHEYEASLDLKNYITDLTSFNKTQETRKKFEEVTNKYKSYWDGVLGRYSRKHARIKRRQYLIEKTESFASECTKKGYDDLAEIFLAYRTEQKELLSKE